MHIPVLQKEVIQYLDPKPNENFIDCTIGEGGHARAILGKIKPRGKILGIEWDPALYKNLLAEKIERLILVNESYTNLEKVVKEKKFWLVSGILFDLGLSSWHLEKSGRGFSFQKTEKLDMRFNPVIQKLTVGEIINQWSESELEKILKEYGQERFSRRIAKAIIKAREIKSVETTPQLVEIIKKAIPLKYFTPTPMHKCGGRGMGRIHPATRTFQALRIAVNQELENLEKTLPQTLRVLGAGGRLAVISFHSLEDKIVKIFFKENKNQINIITKKPIKPKNEEIRGNPRSRSAKLRVAMKIACVNCQ